MLYKCGAIYPGTVDCKEGTRRSDLCSYYSVLLFRWELCFFSS